MLEHENWELIFTELFVDNNNNLMCDNIQCRMVRKKEKRKRKRKIKKFK